MLTQLVTQFDLYSLLLFTKERVGVAPFRAQQQTFLMTSYNVLARPRIATLVKTKSFIMFGNQC